MKYDRNMEYELSVGGREIQNVKLISWTNRCILVQSDAGEIKLSWRKVVDAESLFKVRIDLDSISNVASILCEDPLTKKILENACKVIAEKRYAEAMGMLEGCRQSRSVGYLAGFCAYIQGNHRRAVSEWYRAGAIVYAARMAWEKQYLRLCQQLVFSLINEGSACPEMLELFEELIHQTDVADGLAKLLELVMELVDEQGDEQYQEMESFLTELAYSILEEKGYAFDKSSIASICEALKNCCDNRDVNELIEELPNMVQENTAQEKKAEQHEKCVSDQPEAGQEETQTEPEITTVQTENIEEQSDAPGEIQQAEPETPAEREVYPINKLTEIIRKPTDEMVSGYFRGTLLRRSTTVRILVEEGRTIEIGLGYRGIAEQKLFQVFRAMLGNESQADANREYDIVFKLGVNTKTEKIAIFEAELSPEERERSGVKQWICNADSIKMNVCAETKIANALLEVYPVLGKDLASEQKTVQNEDHNPLRQYDLLVQGCLDVSREDAAGIVGMKLDAMVNENTDLRDIAAVLLRLLQYDCEEALGRADRYKRVFRERIEKLHRNQRRTYQTPHDLVKSLASLFRHPDEILNRGFDTRLIYQIQSVAGNENVDSIMQALRERNGHQ